MVKEGSYASVTPFSILLSLKKVQQLVPGAGSAAELGITVGLLKPSPAFLLQMHSRLHSSYLTLGKEGLNAGCSKCDWLSSSQKSLGISSFHVPPTPCARHTHTMETAIGYALSCKDSSGKSFLIRENNPYTEHKLLGSLSSSEAFLIY